MSHKECGGEIVANWSKIYKHENDFGIEEHPAYLCIKCGKEILGDVDIDLGQEDEEYTSLADDEDRYEQKLRERAITPRRALVALEQLLKDHPECADWPIYSDGCDCTEPAMDFELNPKAAIGPFVALRRVKP